MVKKTLLALGLISMVFPLAAYASEADIAALSVGLDSLWVMLAFILVLLMQGGFILLEAGSTRMKNAGHVAGKTIFTVGLAAIVYWAVGYGVIFGSGGISGFMGWDSIFLNPPTSVLEGESLPTSVFFLFQFAFAAISLSIAWGGFAERAKLASYVVFTLFYVSFIYPIVAHWIWGGGWLANHGAQDFAGSTVVHLTGATAALVATLLLKPRIGKFNKDGSPNEILGHNQVFTALSVLLLWVGWFGFNAGSTVAIGDGFFAYVGFTTLIAAGAGGLAALIISWIVGGKSDITAMLNGVLGGLVAITASCAFVEPWAAAVIGLIAGVLVFYSVKMFNKLKIDDPIYALSVHGMAGIWGTLANGLFATPELADKVGVGQAGLFYGGGIKQLWVQFESVAVAFVFVFAASFIVLYVMKLIIGFRVSEEQEIVGLDLSEHGVYGYPEQLTKKAE
jgi:ammonium transporter, Amt family